MKTLDENISADDIWTYLSQAQQYLQEDQRNTDKVLQMLDKIKEYVRTEENLKNEMMEEYARTIVQYESRFEQELAAHSGN